MKICGRMIDVMQVLWPHGTAIECCWTPSYLGNLLENDIPGLRHGEKMHQYLDAMLRGDYSICGFEEGRCMYAANGGLEDLMVDIDGVDDISDYPKKLMLGFESACNYNCTVCSYHPGDKKTCIPAEDPSDLDKIEARIREALPHLTSISANGAGEFFCSPRIMRLFSEWKPLAPPEECVVEIETNGSLFTPENWRKIENVGKFKLCVYITVMSFHDGIYQHLSGTDLPVSNLENNLRFVKSLREQGIINYLELATVMQEENFREIPEMANRCLDEFCADKFRIRPVFPGGIYDENIQWFMDVRNPYHPYFAQYQKMREDPIFRDPRVLLWSGDTLSNRGVHPGIAAKKKLWAIGKLIDEPDLLTSELKTAKVSVYNMGLVGKMLASQYKDKANILRCYSTRADMTEYQGIPVMQFDKEPGGADAPDTVILAAFNNREKAVKKIRAKLGTNVRIIDIWERLETYDSCPKC